MKPMSLWDKIEVIWNDSSRSRFNLRDELKSHLHQLRIKKQWRNEFQKLKYQEILNWIKERGEILKIEEKWILEAIRYILEWGHVLTFEEAEKIFSQHGMS